MAGAPPTDDQDVVRTILDAAPFPLLISRRSDGTVLYANEGAAAFGGVPATEVIGQKTPEFYADPGDRQTLLEEIERCGRIGNRELRLREAHGRERWALASIVATRLRGEDVLVTGLNDITDRKWAEESLRRSEERFRSLVENANDIIYVLTPPGVFTYVSPNWTEVLGHDVSDIVGEPFAPLVHADDLDACYTFLNTVLETGKKRGGIEYRVRHANGSWRWHTSNASCLKDRDGGVTHFIGIARDITEKKRVQLDLERAHRELREKEAHLIQSERMAALGKLVRGIAHEINSPVGAIGSMCDTLDSAVAKLQRHLASGGAGAAPDPALETILRVIRDASRVICAGNDRVAGIVESLRSFTRLDEADLKACDIHEGIDSALTLLGHELRDRIDVVREYGDVGPVVCHPRQLNQVFLNVLRNASQAITDSGRITIRTCRDGDAVSVTIGDTGCGIPQDQLDHIFEPRFVGRADRIGSSLGLSICYDIMRRHGGRIQVESDLGRGSTFTIVIPRTPRAGPPSPAGPDSVEVV